MKKTKKRSMFKMLLNLLDYTKAENIVRAKYNTI